MSKNQFHSLVISNIQQETNDTFSYSFAIPAALKDEFRYIQGQYLTLKLSINGQEYRRSYSMSSSPLEAELTVTVKRVNKGVVSNYMADHLKKGDTVEVSAPEGRFYAALDAGKRRTFFLFAAGSGITPIMSIAKTVLEEEPMSTVCLFYGNRSEDNIIFRQNLDELSKKYQNQFFVEYILSQPKVLKPSGVLGFLQKGKPSWDGKKGRIDANTTFQFLEEHPKQGTEALYFICGPGEMIDAIQSILVARGVDKKAIHHEYFASASEPKDVTKLGGVEGAKVIVHINKSIVEVNVPQGKTILEVLIDKKLDPPFSCSSGACSTCMAKVLKGSVKMDACFALDEDEVEQGYVLTCQARPTTEEVELTFHV